LHCVMSKAFTRNDDSRDDGLDDDLDEAVAGSTRALGTKNYLTPQGFARLKAELLGLIDEERPKIVEIVHWAASNGDRSENGDYLYGKKRLREIDRRIRFLTKRLEIAEVVDPSVHHGGTQVFFGATVSVENETGEAQTVRIVGIDEAESLKGDISWVSPLAQALLKARVGDEVTLRSPQGLQHLSVLEVLYPSSPPAPR
jgi:transcription elongation factor GreB